MKRSTPWAHEGLTWTCLPRSIFAPPRATSASAKLLPQSGRGPREDRTVVERKHSATSRSVGNRNANERIVSMSVPNLLDAADSALLEGFALAAPASGLYMTSGRLDSIVAGLLGLIGVVVGGLALARPASRIGSGSGRLGAVSALSVGLIGVFIGGLVVATADSGIGTGSGIAGAYVALMVGSIALVLGGLALARSKPRQKSCARPE